ncbi:hypothetical protein DCS_02477 [Drechmeria coniospora]|uniref:Ankyrin repeat protein n=1 Tax=Drechmeria coniospora TaxID=98403 RepID=A0A151GW43_DRECN|nr:hypothetical protein DCS_02477 [Drechmeria coniospora]KYK61335.1 hypothetical protein DCS_02477 [Drechmeria coniospora]
MDPPPLSPTRPISSVIGEIKENAVCLCSSVIKAADAAAVEPGHISIRSLATELRVFAGAIFSLESLASSIEEVRQRPVGFLGHDRQDLAFLENLRFPLEFIEDNMETFSQHDMAFIKSQMVACRASITHCIARSRTYDDLLFLLASADIERGFGTNPSDVCRWLEILNSPYHDRPVRDYHEEKHLLENRSSDFPIYTFAATTWPSYAQKYWPTIRPQVEKLFSEPQANNFAHWLLEFARACWPRHHRYSASDPEHTVHLPAALRNGSATPLHLAAVLGLPELCASLVSAGADVNLAGDIGSPLYCALLGLEALRTGLSPWLPGGLPDTTWISDGEADARAAVVLELIRAGADCTYRFLDSHGERASLAGHAYVFSCAVRCHEVFGEVLSRGAALDGFFVDAVSHIAIDACDMDPSKTWVTALTAAFDATFCDDEGWPWDRFDAVQATIQELLGNRPEGCEFLFRHGDKATLHRISDDDFSAMVVDAVQDDAVFYMKRILRDPRFDPKMHVAEQLDEGSIAHLAVGGNQIEMVELFLKSGVDFTTRDERGRTPMLLVEDALMFVTMTEHNIPTTDVDLLGFNLWHYAAATNDRDLLEALACTDPCKQQNLLVSNKLGLTPLDEALRFVDLLRLSARDGDMAVPIAAELILRAGGNPKLSPAPYPRFLSAVEWCSAELAVQMLAAGANPRAINDHGMTALHHIGPSAPAELVSLLLKVCEGMPVVALVPKMKPRPRGPFREWVERFSRNRGLTYAETILNNMELFVVPNDLCDLSQHPSCRDELSSETYRMLLTPEVLDYHDPGGAGLWQRFCSRLLPRYDHHMSFRHEHDMGLYRRSFATALKALTRAGAPVSYELETGRAAVLCLGRKDDADQCGGKQAWPPDRLAFVADFLRNFHSEPTEVFYRSQESRDLLAAADDAGVAVASTLRSAFRARGHGGAEEEDNP